jgi:hypothetical protein
MQFSYNMSLTSICLSVPSMPTDKIHPDYLMKNYFFQMIQYSLLDVILNLAIFMVHDKM